MAHSRNAASICSPMSTRRAQSKKVRKSLNIIVEKSHEPNFADPEESRIFTFWKAPVGFRPARKGRPDQKDRVWAIKAVAPDDIFKGLILWNYDGRFYLNYLTFAFDWS